MGGINPDEMAVRVGDYGMDSGYKLAESLLNVPKSERPTALLCANDMMAIGALEYCKASGIRVPGDISIVGFDDVPTAQLLTPRLTTVRQPAYEMGISAAELLIGLTQGKENAELLKSHPVEMVVRESTGIPK
jgi:DNA-binding LacI/PurR family transcriptional regulator